MKHSDDPKMDSKQEVSQTPVSRETPEDKVERNKDKKTPNIHKNMGETAEDDVKSLAIDKTGDRIKPFEFQDKKKK